MSEREARALADMLSRIVGRHGCVVLARERLLRGVWVIDLHWQVGMLTLNGVREALRYARFYAFKFREHWPLEPYAAA